MVQKFAAAQACAKVADYIASMDDNMLAKLRVKYGLMGAEPSAEQAKKWAARVKELKAAGEPTDQACEHAASELFDSYRSTS